MTYRIVAYGDLHGSNAWKTVDPEVWDSIVFLGDYVDQRLAHIRDSDVITNLCDLIAFKRAHMDKVELLLGNHDLQYMFPEKSLKLAGYYNPAIADSLTMLFQKNKKLFSVGLQAMNLLFSHAGITSGWLSQNNIANTNITNTLNELYLKEDDALFQVSSKYGGDRVFGSPMWAHEQDIWNSGIPANYHQIVGHHIVPIAKRVPFADSSITFIDDGYLTPYKTILSYASQQASKQISIEENTGDD